MDKIKYKDLSVFLALQVAAGFNAPLMFKLIADRQIAGLMAGVGFLAVGLYAIFRTLRWENKLRHPTFHMVRLHTWLFTLPILLVRIQYWGHDFSQLHFLGIPGPDMHKYSEKVYLVMMAATLFDWWRIRHQIRSN